MTLDAPLEGAFAFLAEPRVAARGQIGMLIEITLRWMNDVVEVHRLDDVADAFTLGTLPDDDLFVPLLGRASHTLLAKAPDGRVWLTPLDGAPCPMDERTHATFSVGPFSVDVKATLPIAHAPFLPSFDALFANVTTLSMSMMAMFVAILVLLPTSVRAADDPLPTSRWISVLKVPLKMDLAHFDVPARATAEPHADPLARAPSTGGAKTTQPAVDIAGMFDNVPAHSSSISLADWKRALGHVPVAGGNEHGIVSRDIGGPDTGTQHIGGVSGIGDAPGTRSTDDPCDGCLAPHVEHVIDPVNTEVHVHGPLDKEIIRRVVREHMAQVRYCYEKTLQTNPGLAGKASIEWVIEPSGKVTLAHPVESTVGSAVSGCVAGKVQTWRFPSLPAGSGSVAVRYPFLFKPT